VAGAVRNPIRRRAVNADAGDLRLRDWRPSRSSSSAHPVYWARFPFVDAHPGKVAGFSVHVWSLPSR
jgi:hypothetical protein